MRTVVLSDIHGNLAALEAVLKDVEQQAPDEIWCGGDLGWGGPWASECIQRVRDAGWTTVKGNTDVWITGDPQTVESQEGRREHQAMASAHDISEDDARWLLQLPLGHSGPGSLLMVHGTPVTPFDAPQPHASAAEFEPYENQASLIVYAHVHRAFVRRLADGTLVCNTGAVGIPLDDDTASYLIIDREGPELVLQHRRVAFDIDAVISEAKRLGGPIETSILNRWGGS